MDGTIGNLDFFDYLEAFVHDHHSFIQLFLCRLLVKSFIPVLVSNVDRTYNIGDDAGQQHRLLVFMRALLEECQLVPSLISSFCRI